jgi:glycosyltransferase involved in cell wall biosynthesis
VANRESLAKLLAAADVVIAPGPAETFGLSALEALASGTPVVVSSRSALPEVVGQAGLAADDNDVACADAVQRLLRREPAERRRLATRHPAYTSALTPGGVSVYVRSALAKESGTQREEGRAWFRRQRCRVLPGW